MSLYYNFTGAIDNIYASLIAWLVLTRDFGGIRLWHDRAEFEVKGSGLCGLRKVTRDGRGRVFRSQYARTQAQGFH